MTDIVRSAGEWRPDPAGRYQYRYRDGDKWTDQVSDDGACRCA